VSGFTVSDIVPGFFERYQTIVVLVQAPEQGGAVEFFGGNGPVAVAVKPVKFFGQSAATRASGAEIAGGLLLEMLRSVGEASLAASVSGGATRNSRCDAQNADADQRAARDADFPRSFSI